ncbi:MAG: hypothetical protein FWE91_10795 [Defluviitaleaceae bacterium]|nr:hypothetical protein [Defluviitaleaceae bacterium]
MFNPGDFDTVTSGGMTVTLYKKFPSVIKYSVNRKTIDGLRSPVNSVSIGLIGADPPNSVRDYIPRKVDYKKTGSDNAAYTLYIDDIFIITVNFKAVEKTLIIDTLKIEELTSLKLKSIFYPNNGLVSVSSANNAQIAMMWAEKGDHTDTPPVGGSVYSPDINPRESWNRQYDRILDLKSCANATAVLIPRADKNTLDYIEPAAEGTPITHDEAAGRNVSVIFFSNGGLSATMINNRSSEGERMWYNLTRAGESVVSGQIGEARHYYRHEASVETRKTLKTVNEKLLLDELPLTKVIITEDTQRGTAAYK